MKKIALQKKNKVQSGKHEENKLMLPKWMDCTWKRIACGKETCPICGKIKEDSARHLAKGENPDDIKVVFTDLSGDFKKVIRMISRDARRMGIKIANIDHIQEPPPPEHFPLYHQAEKWRESIYGLAEKGRMSGETWIMLEAADDLLWYANLLPVKSYRQLCNRWHLMQKDEYGDYDYEYTAYVLDETFKIIGRSISQILPYNSNFLIARAELEKLKAEVLKV